MAPGWPREVLEGASSVQESRLELYNGSLNRLTETRKATLAEIIHRLREFVNETSEEYFPTN